MLELDFLKRVIVAYKECKSKKDCWYICCAEKLYRNKNCNSNCKMCKVFKAEMLYLHFLRKLK